MRIPLSLVRPAAPGSRSRVSVSTLAQPVYMSISQCVISSSEDPVECDRQKWSRWRREGSPNGLHNAPPLPGHATSPSSQRCGIREHFPHHNASNTPMVETLTGPGTATASHSVGLDWNPSPSAVVGYNVYRGAKSGGPYTKVNPVLNASTSYVDNSVRGRNHLLPREYCGE